MHIQLSSIYITPVSGHLLGRLRKESNNCSAPSVSLIAESWLVTPPIVMCTASTVLLILFLSPVWRLFTSPLLGKWPSFSAPTTKTLDGLCCPRSLLCSLEKAAKHLPPRWNTAREVIGWEVGGWVLRGHCKLPMTILISSLIVFLRISFTQESSCSLSYKDNFSYYSSFITCTSYTYSILTQNLIWFIMTMAHITD